ncbi:hypothetical protein AMATHDRAFT_1134 [Amanita thiersii Skay4041]|uniref:FAD dependent oxidoreductase domain-containing protein n=1 Tax=Amanita thiersii Skay4041 TaxID=703135 RepID=A0A2A9NZR5_9AGAR|nr:hypothetical protein AMATHDRAFT_1134 [Amanita thiersii Skay4041]
MSNKEDREIVIVGGGIIGCTTAYYLTRHRLYSPHSTRITLIEASVHGAAQGASGKAGGLIAKWAYPKELVDISFNEHVKLAETHGGARKWGWRYVNCGSWEGKGELPSGGEMSTGENKSLEKTLGLGLHSYERVEKGLPDDLLWVREDLTKAYSPMAPAGATAQVHPYLFTSNMLELAAESGVTILKGRVTSVVQKNGKVTGVQYLPVDTAAGAGTLNHLSATHVVIAAGAWSPSIVSELPVSATRAHSITIRPKDGVTIAPYVLFTEISLTSGRSSRRKIVATPEIYARRDNEVYACGPGDDSDLPGCVDDVVVDESACDSILQHITSISRELRDGMVEKRQACFLPIVSSGGGPIIGECERLAKGLIVATGHTCWGICNAPGTALVVSELVMEGRIQSGDLQRLRPSETLHYLYHKEMQRISYLTNEDPLVALCLYFNVPNVPLPSGELPKSLDLPLLHDARTPTHILAAFQSGSRQGTPPLILPIDAGLYSRGFQAALDLPPTDATSTVPSASQVDKTTQKVVITLPVVPFVVPHVNSLALLLLFGLDLETQPNLLAWHLLPPQVIGEFPNAAAMAQVLSRVPDDEFNHRFYFNQGLWRNILMMGLNNERLVQLVHTAWNVTNDARRIRQRNAVRYR